MKKILYITFLLLVFSLSDVYAQCAMCRAGVQTSISSGGGIGSGLNAGIIYLGAIPYLVIGLLAWVWYSNARRLSPKQRRYQHR